MAQRARSGEQSPTSAILILCLYLVVRLAHLKWKINCRFGLSFFSITLELQSDLIPELLLLPVMDEAVHFSVALRKG